MEKSGFRTLRKSLHLPKEAFSIVFGDLSPQGHPSKLEQKEAQTDLILCGLEVKYMKT